ncbi:DUF3006 domain-containing protein [Halobacillus yeomjeoni]|uniref:DUF3006 domain-containing protein n=1 Tax=Halobacillus yeomjeoni TaxID=311194 RepID=A0A931MTV1_9BACI|nr:DUF3006 domain-containing protein [Halobacillus yeomjeoni]MBH0228826.1 DUF3006 domain-containing protein [Halobacillus yeomjeoni]
MSTFIVDRIEGDLVVLLKQGDESIQKDVPIDVFQGMVKDGDVVEEIHIDGKTSYTILGSETARRRQRAEDLLEKIKNKNNFE